MSTPSATPAPRSSTMRWTVLTFTLVAFAHVALGLAYKDLWWDESLSLQRAESALMPLLRGVIVIQDGYTQVPTIDQHPFFSFLLQGALVRMAGDSEYVLRFVSVAAATLLVPALFAFARLYTRREVASPTTPIWVALLAALSPFFLWYGQEARPYALWAMLAVVTTYLLLSALEDRPDRHWRGWAYAISLIMFLTTHYYSVFLLPLHALIAYVAISRKNRARALAIAAGLMVVGLAIAAAAWWMVRSQGGGGNFSFIALGILLPDLLNAFSMGLSVNIDTVRWLDYIIAIVAIAGAAWTMRSRQTWRDQGWVATAWLVIPIVVLVLANSIQGVYMNARHMSLIAGAWLFLVGAGIGVLWTRWRPLAAALAVLIVAGFAYSTFNYYAREEYAKDDFSSLGAYLDGRMMPGDLILYYPPSAWRIFEYYAPMGKVHAAIEQGADMGVYGAPLLDAKPDTFAWLKEISKGHPRIWMLKSGTHPYYDLSGQVEYWMRQNFLQVRDSEFFSQSSLRAQLYLPTIPVFEGDAPDVTNPVSVVFDDKVRLTGFDVGTLETWGLPLPITLYWQVPVKPERRYKYILQLEAETPGGRVQLGTVEREPYEGDIPTTFWDPGKTIQEFVELSFQEPPADASSLYLTVQMYDAETLEKLPVSDAGGLSVENDGIGVRLPAPREW